MSGKTTRHWTTTLVTVAVMLAGSATCVGAAGRAAGPDVQRGPGGVLASDVKEPASLLDPSFGGGAGGTSPSFGVVVSASPSQDDPTAQLPVEFEVAFEVPIDPATFDVSDVVQDGTASGVVWEIVNSGDDTTFQLRAVGVQGPGTLSPSVPADAVTSGDVATNEPSVGAGNTVAYSGAGVAAAGPAFVYAGVWNPARIHVFRADPPTVLSAAQAPVDVSGESDVRDMAVDPSGSQLYYASGDMRRFSIDPASGELGSMSVLASGPGNIDSITFNSTGTKLYATQNQGALLIFDLPGGSIVQQAGSLIMPRGVIVDPADTYVYIANGFDPFFSPGSEEIVRFGLGADGLLNAGPFVTSYGPKPEHFAVDPCGKFLLHTQQPGHKVLTEGIGGGGSLSLSNSEPAGPAALRLLLVPLDATCTNSALYVINELADTVSVFHVDSNGDLTFLEDEATGVRPEDLIKHPTANVLYVLASGDYTGQSTISIYEIDETTGELTYVGQRTMNQEGGFRLAIKYAS